MSRHFLLVLAAFAPLLSRAAYVAPVFPFAPAAGSAGSTAVAWNDPLITGWATAVATVDYGEDVAQEWRTPEKALGPATSAGEGVLVLGRGGEAVLEFNPPIRDGEGDDFAVFENAFSDTFLELAYVEVSSDGVHFVRFPNYSYTPSPVDPFGLYSLMDPIYVHGFAGKYRAGFGTPFDIGELAEAHAAALAGDAAFSNEFSSRLVENFPFLDKERIRYVRLVDVVGDGTATDAEGAVVYDPYKTSISAGFDLDAIGVINHGDQEAVPFAVWSSFHGLSADPQADTDRDGWPQYLEYLMGSDPSSVGNRPRVAQEAGADGVYTLTFPRSATALGVLEVQYSDDGIRWRTLNGPPGIEDLPIETIGGVVLHWRRTRLLMVPQALLVRFVGRPE